MRYNCFLTTDLCLGLAALSSVLAAAHPVAAEAVCFSGEDGQREWQRQVSNTRTFELGPYYLLQADEIAEVPAPGEDLGSTTLTFPSEITGLPSFVIRALSEDADHWIVGNGEFKSPTAYLMPGEIDMSPDDGFEIEFTGDVPVYGIVFWLIDNGSHDGESITVYGEAGEIVSCPPPTGGAQFVGIAANERITRVVFDHGDGEGDDLAIGGLRFVLDPYCPGDVTGSTGVGTEDLILILGNWGLCP